VHLAHLNLTVRDVDASIAFYRQWFGFTAAPRRYPDGTVFVNDADGFDLALHPGDVASPPAAAVHFGFRCSSPHEARALRDRLATGGVALHEQYDEADYVNAKCFDPDGLRDRDLLGAVTFAGE